MFSDKESCSQSDYKSEDLAEDFGTDEIDEIYGLNCQKRAVDNNRIMINKIGFLKRSH